MAWYDWLASLWHRPPQASPVLESEAEQRRIAEEQRQMKRDVEQVKRINEFLLNKAVRGGWISSEMAAAVRASQAYEKEELGIAPPA